MPVASACLALSLPLASLLCSAFAPCHIDCAGRSLIKQRVLHTADSTPGKFQSDSLFSGRCCDRRLTSATRRAPFEMGTPGCLLPAPPASRGVNRELELCHTCQHVALHPLRKASKPAVPRVSPCSQRRQPWCRGRLKQQEQQPGWQLCASAAHAADAWPPDDSENVVRIYMELVLKTSPTCTGHEGKCSRTRAYEKSVCNSQPDPFLAWCMFDFFAIPSKNIRIANAIRCRRPLYLHQAT